MATATKKTKAATRTKAADHFFANARVINGRAIDNDVESTLAEARLAISGQIGRPVITEKIRRRRFVPLKSEKRFRVFDMRDPTRSFDPQGPLDISPKCELYGEYLHGEHEFLTRAAALAEAARLNREAMAAKKSGFTFWAVVVESGQPMPLQDLEINLKPGLVGCEKRHETYPVRFIVLTKKELRQYATK